MSLSYRVSELGCGMALAALLGSCDPAKPSAPSVRAPAPSVAITSTAHAARTAIATHAARAAHEPIHIELLDASEAPPTFAMRGKPHGPGLLVFLHGMCGHGLGYAQSFQHSAAKFGLLIAPQADIPCGGGPWAKWSPNLDTLDQRIVDAFRKLGRSEPITDVTVLGYSQGATRAESLARRWPERYTRLILMGGPQAPLAQGLGGLRGAVMMAGEHDRRDLMERGARSYAASKIPATFRLIPEARHGEMGPTPEKTMGEALAWLFDNSKPSPAR